MNSLESTKSPKTLHTAGVPAEQATAHADALGEVLESLASKEWVTSELKQQLGDLKFDMLKWMISLFIAQTSLTIGSIIALIRYLPH
jgi:DNA-binding SARP family transcriptional activator